ncbi:unnamed protein product [Ceutorhynchus assimilis]|uniref:DNA-directed RNA polymerase III subunit RPC4 n=1 Tax=Ceutorhynchus assimilis TaxID=467358 RepID=A0A9N9QI54_9CUCU|nr:unnamed protein product [Ceutorhynchus assimilis]
MEKRLQSFRLPRDLTLGGSKPKKKFVPNLSVARNKDNANGLSFIKIEDKKKLVPTKKPTKNSQKFAGKSERFLQSNGIFSEGIGSDVKKARNERTYNNSPRNEPINGMTIPKLKKDKWQVNHKNETRVYEDLMDCESSSIDNEILAFAPTVWNENDFKGLSSTLSSTKTEFTLEPKIDLDRLKILANDLPKEFQNGNHFSDSNPSIALWNFPDSLAEKGLSENPNIDTLFDSKLANMPEGQIGKLRVHKSGKIDIIIGGTKYEIAPTPLESLPERVISIETNKKDVGKALVLGEIQHRYVLNPEWAGLVRGFKNM